MKKTTLIIITAILAISSFATIAVCNSSALEKSAAPAAQSAIESETENQSSSDAVYANYRSNSPLFHVLYDTIKECESKGATGYTVCKLHGSNSYHLVVSYGNYEFEKYYDVYKIGKTDVTYAGQLSGSHTTAYIDSTTCKLSLFYAHMGVYSYGSVWADDELRVEYDTQNILDAGEEYPVLPGEAISFSDINNFNMIGNF